MSQQFTGKPQFNRVVNRRLILERIRRAGEISRADLAKVTAIRPPTVSAVIRELIDEGWVQEVGNGESRGGRAPRMVALSRRQARAVGFELRGSAILAGVCDLAGELVAQARVAFSPRSPELTVDRLSDLGEDLLAGLGLSWPSIEGVGVAVPGLMDAARGVVRWSRPLNWREVAFKRMCELRWGTPTDVVNNSVAGTMAAHFLGPGQEVKNLIYIYARFHVVEPEAGECRDRVIRLGSGVIVHGEPYYGEFGAAGEISGLIDHPLVDSRDEHGRPFPDTQAFGAAYEAGQASAVAAMDRVVHDISLLVVHAVNFLDPGLLVIGSDVAVLRDAIVERLRRIFDEDRLRKEAGRTRVIASALGEFDMVRGAVVPTLQRVFQMPRWT